MPIFPLLLILFFTIPLVEIYILIQVGGVIGVWPTVGLVVFTAVLGAFLLRRQGLATLTRMQRSLDQGQLPATELVEGVFLVFGGALLLTPGFFTDALGFACLIPATRRVMARWLMSKGVFVARGHVHQAYTRRRGPYPGGEKGHTIEGEWEREPDSRDSVAPPRDEEGDRRH
ncbi:FxsA family protein [Ectothiorhodospira mobilis]|uniref:FxsA family protein n=1 Tax=Ectothiorhodospira mobilis TaxID=195064 RepID=UPI0019056AA1|nr:FxsA family protein [Ectothiorhodospira mobilis]MBK1691617.1 exlusion protein FxsA [Ectothiorhodospira mobilis]